MSKLSPYLTSDPGDGLPRHVAGGRWVLTYQRECCCDLSWEEFKTKAQAMARAEEVAAPDIRELSLFWCEAPEMQALKRWDTPGLWDYANPVDEVADAEAFYRELASAADKLRHLP